MTNEGIVENHSHYRPVGTDLQIRVFQQLFFIEKKNSYFLENIDTRPPLHSVAPNSTTSADFFALFCS